MADVDDDDKSDDEELTNDEDGPLERLGVNTEITFAADQGDAPGPTSSGSHGVALIALAIPTVSAILPRGA
jgi:hypothetical protein